MTDRELLELAAKAAGFRVVGRSPTTSLYIESDGCKGGVVWTPLTDDGDALRLAVKLRIEPHFVGKEIYAIVLQGSDVGEWETTLSIQKTGKDPCAATRRAIVCAAAEIGKATP